MKTYLKVLQWLPRIICILAILLVSIFAADAFNPEYTIWQQISGFVIHLIPSFILLAILVISWKREFFGGIIFTIIGIAFTPFIYDWNHRMNHSVGMSLGIVFLITFPFFVVGVLFLLSYFAKKNQQKKDNLK